MRDAEILREIHLDKIVHTLIEGLLTDGGHHKQFYLEEALRLFCCESWVDEANSELEWEDGIPS